MKILINSSTLKGTGVTQVAVSFINECTHFCDNEYIVFLSPNVSSNINKETFPSNFSFYEFGKHSLYGIMGIPDLYRMKRIEAAYKPDVVFSVFGPALWKPKSPHLQGYAYPYYVYTDSPLFEKLSLKDKFGIWLRRHVHISHMKREGRFFVCETEDVSRRLHEMYSIDTDNIYTVSNTANSFFLNFKSNEKLNIDPSVFKFYSLCSNSPHKNLSILNSVIPLLKAQKLKKKILFYVTIPNEEYEKTFIPEVRNDIINVGPLKVADCPAFVDSCDALFLPTLLECFSASYPEAMLLRKPIVTSDLSFAKIVCEDAALYFNPLNASDIVDKLTSLVNNNGLIEGLQIKGEKQIGKFLSPKQRAEAYLNICKEISNEHY